MTTEISLEELDGTVDDGGVRRDQWGRYMILPPGEDRPRGYRRVTTICKALDAEGSLIPWSQGRALLGAVRDPTTLRKLRQLVGRHPDPWYTDDSKNKTAFKGLIDGLAKTGGREEKAQLGTNLHALFAAKLTGGLPAFNALLGSGTSVSEDVAWVDQLERTLAASGVVIDPTYVEQLVVHDAYGIAGTADYLRVTVPGFDLPMIGDLKTGDEGSLHYAVAGYTIQIAMYQAADCMYFQGAAADGSEDERRPMPELDHEHGLLISAPSSGAEPELYVVDLVAGRHGFELALAVERWRQRDNFITVLDMVPKLQRSIDAVEAPSATPDPSDASTATTEGSQGPVALPPVDELRAWLQSRIDVVGVVGDKARAQLNRTWPEGVPPLRRADDHTRDQLAAIEAVLDRVEADHSIPFGPSRPGVELSSDARTEYLMRVFPGSTLEPVTETTNNTNGATS